MSKKPNFFIVGTPKAGTTSLNNYLKKSPEIYMVKMKEPEFFSVVTVPKNHPYVKPIREYKNYLELFNQVKNEKIIGEASPHYLADPKTPDLINKFSPDSKILISLRDPVERAFSHYLMLESVGLAKPSFFEEWQLETQREPSDYSKPHALTIDGLYYEPIKRYLKIFGSKRVKIIIFEEWKLVVTETINQILKFLELDNQRLEIDNIAYNAYASPRDKFSKYVIKSGGTISKISRIFISKHTRMLLRKKIFLKPSKKPTLNIHDIKLLVEYYQNDVMALENLLGRKLPWINFNKK